MSSQHDQENKSSDPAIYEIRIKGHLGQQWAEWFGGLTVTLEADGYTLLTGPVQDQAELYGVIKKIRDLGLPLIALNRTRLGQDSIPDDQR